MTTPRGPQPFPGQEKRLRLLAFVRQDSVVRVDKRVEDTAMTWPHLLVIEFIAAMIWSLGLFAISALFNAPRTRRRRRGTCSISRSCSCTWTRASRV
jgi:hypothetical protein